MEESMTLLFIVMGLIVIGIFGPFVLIGFELLRAAFWIVYGIIRVVVNAILEMSGRLDPDDGDGQ